MDPQLPPGTNHVTEAPRNHLGPHTSPNRSSAKFTNIPNPLWPKQKIQLEESCFENTPRLRRPTARIVGSLPRSGIAIDIYLNMMPRYLLQRCSRRLNTIANVKKEC